MRGVIAFVFGILLDQSRVSKNSSVRLWKREGVLGRARKREGKRRNGECVKTSKHQEEKSSGVRGSRTVVRVNARDSKRMSSVAK